MILTVLSVVAVAGVAEFMFLSSQNNGEVPEQTFKEVVVKKGDIRISFDSEGTSALSLTALRFPVSGQLSEVKVEPGDHVLAGEVLAVLDHQELNGRLETARLNYQQALVKLEKTREQYASSLVAEKAKLEAMSYQVENAKRDYESMAAIPEAYPAYDVETKRIALENASVSYEAATVSYASLTKGSRDIELDQLSVRQAATALEEAERALYEATLKAPADGTVLVVNGKAGEMISSAADFIQLSDGDGMTITSLVSELDIASVEIGQGVELEFEALEGQSFNGKVLAVDPLAQKNESGLVNYTVRIGMDDASDKILDGMSCNVAYVLREKENVLIIPNASVKMIEGKQTVEVKTETGELVARQVSTGLTDGFNVEVIEGLEAGEVVIIRQK